ncbi:MAG: alpha/beta hydrolase [Clostridia bacterium]|nr:alpha/beta hydrolase [Clostridia bacterium]
MLKKLKKFFLINTAVTLSVILLLSLFCHFVRKTSINAFIASVYLQITDFNGIYESTEKCYQALKDMKEANLSDIEVPKMKCGTESHRIGKTQYLTVGMENESDSLIFYFPGGGFIDQPKSQHWSFLNKLTSQTGIPVIVPVYLKVTSYCAEEAYADIIEIYSKYTDSTKLKNIILMGDSSGGNMALSLAMQLRETDMPQPGKIIVISPWMDLSMKNPEMEGYKKGEFMVGLSGLEILGKKWAGEKSIYDPVISPLYGNFNGLGEIVIFSGAKDMLHPDILRFGERLEKDKADFNLYVEENLPHVYPLFPTPEASKAFELIKYEVLY